MMRRMVRMGNKNHTMMKNRMNMVRNVVNCFFKSNMRPPLRSSYKMIEDEEQEQEQY